MKPFLIAVLVSAILIGCGTQRHCDPVRWEHKTKFRSAKLIDILKPNRDRYALIFLYKEDTLRIPFAGWQRGRPSKGWIIGQCYFI